MKNILNKLIIWERTHAEEILNVIIAAAIICGLLFLITQLQNL